MTMANLSPPADPPAAMNSKECLKKAQEYMEQASRATSDEAQAELLQLATEWVQIAEEMDRLKSEVPRHSGRGTRVDEYEERAFQYRQRAEELRVILPDMTDPYCHDTLKKIAVEYDRLAGVQDKLRKINAASAKPEKLN